MKVWDDQTFGRSYRGTSTESLEDALLDAFRDSGLGEGSRLEVVRIQIGGHNPIINEYRVELVQVPNPSG